MKSNLVNHLVMSVYHDTKKIQTVFMNMRKISMNSLELSIKSHKDYSNNILIHSLMSLYEILSF